MKRILAALVGLALAVGAAGAAHANQTPAFSRPAPHVLLLNSQHRPPSSGAKVKPLTGCTTNCFHYSGYWQTSPPVGLTGIYDGKDIESPAVTGGDLHSLEETAVRDSTTSNHNVVEVGYTVDHALNGDNHPHLFTYWWKNGVGQGYNLGSGFVTCTKVAPFNCGTAAIAWPGDDLNASVTSPPTLMRFGIEHTGTGATGAWFVTYGTGFVGYYPDSLWGSGVFTSIAFFENFGEVFSPGATPCSQMTDGTYATSSAGPRDATLTYSVASPVPTYNGSINTDPTYYNATYSGTSTRTFRVGGDNTAC